MGVWIETLAIEKAIAKDDVTPCMGVWIETFPACRIGCRWLSHPVWVCGLKQDRTSCHTCEGRSHPVWVCGLKRKPLYDY